MRHGKHRSFISLRILLLEHGLVSYLWNIGVMDSYKEAYMFCACPLDRPCTLVFTRDVAYLVPILAEQGTSDECCAVYIN